MNNGRNINTLPPRYCKVGLEFVAYLNETNRINIHDRTSLQQIYNSEFKLKRRDGVQTKDPDFCSILYALRLNSRARVTKDRKVYFANDVLRDQWYRPRNRQQSSTRSSPPPSNGLDAGASPAAPVSDAEGGIKARRKLARELLGKLRKNRSEFMADKNGIQITSELEMVNDKMCICVERKGSYERKLFVENKGASDVYFTYYSPLQWMHCFKFEDSARVTRNDPRLIGPGETYEVKLTLFAEDVGVFASTVAFEFKSTHLSSRPFHIVRFIEAEFRNQLVMALAPVEPYKPFRLSSLPNVKYNVDEGQKPQSQVLNRLGYEVLLQDYNCPGYINDLTTILKDASRVPRGHLQDKKSLLETPLSFQNYADRFHLLLYLEEAQMLVDIKRYNKENVTMTKDKQNKKLLELEVPGVSENRPSVLRGDHLLLTKSEDLNLSFVTKYKGYVHRVELDKLKLGFSPKFLSSFINNMRFQVEFTFNPLLMRLQHRAVQLAVDHSLEEVLFPTGPTAPSSDNKPPLNKLFDRTLEKNHEQYTAVCNIVAGVSKPAPYLVFGPPGTGKTVTMVEAIKQVEKCIPGARILACAPSNSAADQLCEKLLLHVDSHKLYRIYALSRSPAEIPPSLLDCCNLTGDDYEYPSKQKLMDYKILVTTAYTAGRLVTGGLPVGHFTHIFVDEAGHAVESEAIIGIAGLLRAETGQLVLAGDPKQLGPILRSPIAIQYGLGLSLLERLMTKNPLYQKGETGFNPRYVTKLLQNYRSHRSILKIPNEMFYDGELQARADEYSTSLYCNWEHLPKRGFPLIFHGVQGKDERESNSPSFFNTTEITKVIDYLKKLLLTQGKKGIAKISPKEIGIITPYRKQVEKLRKAIRMCDKELKVFNGIDELKVGSVEEFQGQERRVIIVSTVRSSGEYINIDADFNIGFLNNEKRFNVAMTRAKSLLIVVGNPIILSSDSTWSRFIQYCNDEGGYTGMNRTNIEGTDEIIARIAALSIQMAEEVDTGESSIQAYAHPEWRNEQ